MYNGKDSDPFDAGKNGTGQGSEASGSRQQREEQATANPPAEGSHCTNFSVQRLLPPPSSFAPEMLQDDPHSTQDHRPAAGAVGLSPEHNLHPSHAMLHNVGYGDLYHSEEPGPSRQHYGDPGPSSRQRWSNFFQSPSYPVAHPSAPSPTSPTHLDIVATPTSPSPPQPTNGYMDIYHPDNAGLHTLCQAATLMSSEEEGSSAFDFQPHVQMNNIPSHPPPPYYYHFQSQPCENPLPPQSNVPDQTSPVSPPPMYIHVQDSGQPGPSYLNQQETGTCEDLEDPDPAYLSEQPGPSFLNLNEVVEDMEEPGLSNSSFAQLPSDNITHQDEEIATGLQPSSSMVLPLPQNEPGEGSGSVPPVSQAETPAIKSSTKQKSKRTRTAYTQAQQDQLEMAYHANPYPDNVYRQKVSDLTGIPPDRIQVWFQNRRARGKKQARTGSISVRSKIREERLQVNLQRQSAIAEAAQHLGISIPQNILAAAACNMQSQGHQQQQPGPGVIPSVNPQTQNEEETHPIHIQQQSNQLSSEQNSEMQQQENQLQQSSSESIHPGPLFPQFQPHLQMTAATPNAEANTSAQNENCPQSLPLMPSFGPVASIRHPPPYNHLAGSATICYYPSTPSDPGQGNNPTSSLPVPSGHLSNMYCFPPPPGPSLNQSNPHGPSPPQPHTPGPSPPQPHTPAASTPQQVPIPHPMGPSFHHFHPLGPPFSHPLGPSFPHQPPAPSIPLPGPSINLPYTPAPSFPLPHHPAPSFPVPLLPHPTPSFPHPPLPPPHMLFPPSGTTGLIPTSPPPSPHQFAAISNLVPHPESPQASESPDQNQQQSS